MRKRKEPTENESQLGNLLERYKRILVPPQASVEKEAIAVIKEVTNITLTTTQVSYTVGTRTLAIVAPSLIRSELKTHHGAIMKELQHRLGVKNAPGAII